MPEDELGELPFDPDEDYDNPDDWREYSDE